MLALRYHSIGDLAGLGLEDIPVPVPAADEVTAVGSDITTVPNAATLMLDPLANRLCGVQRHGVMFEPDAGVMEDVLGYWAQRRLQCVIEHEFPLERALEALERSRSGRLQGKIVLVI